jgi:hypothetical protein
MGRPNNRDAEQNNKGARLRIAFEHAALERLISEIQSDDEDFDRLCKALHAYCELRKQDAALEKNQLDKAKACTAATRSPATPPQRTAAAPNLSAPFGLNDNGNPNTKAEFQASLRQTINDVYGTAEPDANPTTKPPMVSAVPGQGEHPKTRPKQGPARTEND